MNIILVLLCSINFKVIINRNIHETLNILFLSNNLISIAINLIQNHIIML